MIGTLELIPTGADKITEPGSKQEGDVLTYSNGSWVAAAIPSITVDSALSSSSTNPVQNKIVKQALDNVAAIALPSGGEAGQLLMKTSNVDYITEWVSPANQMEQDNTRPITSGAVYTTVGNIQQLLALI